MLNKSYIWTTLSNHLARSDDEIIELCGVNLVFLGPARYGILRKICRPLLQSSSDSTTCVSASSITPNVRSRKTTCHEGGAIGRKKHEHSAAQGCGKQWTVPTSTSRKRPQTLSESHSQTYGITTPVTRSLRSGLKPIDYVSLNDGFEDDSAKLSKKKKCESYRPRGAPSATRVAARKNTISPEAKDPTNKPDVRKSNTLSGVPLPNIPITDTALNLTGVPDPANPDTLPDLINSRLGDTENIEGEIDAIDALLSLGDTRDNPLDEDDNAALMPISAPTGIVDAAPIPILLDQINIDNAIANIIETEENEQEREKPTDQTEINNPRTSEETDPTFGNFPDPNPGPNSGSTTQGSLQIKTHALKKKTDRNHKYKCSVCGETRCTMQQVNAHHLEKHKLQICTICGRTFALASSLIRHAYDHEENRYKCNACDYAAHFESELNTHKVVHRKQPSFQCMVKNCGKWFRRKWEFTMHVKKHAGEILKCDVCDFTTNLNKHLKEHKHRHSDDCPYICTICNKGFRYRSGLKRHRDSVHN